MAIAGNILKFIFQTSLPAIICGSLLTGLGTNFLLMMGGLFVVGCMDYGEWRTGKRLEGIINSLLNLMSKLGMAIAAAGVGFIMDYAGYESSASTQSPAALSSIVALFSIIPAGVSVVMLILIHFYDLEKKMQKIKEELADRRIQNGN
jgi:GPH family glycoside/pentoside/hexuronide:cation symporter